MKNKDSIRDMREDYRLNGLKLEDIAKDPLEQFARWLSEAIDAGEIEPNAMVLSTVNSTSQPSSRVVLLKEIQDGRLVFFTNYESQKGREIEGNNLCSVVFWWRLLQRQVRVEGAVSKVSNEVSDDYFKSRPTGSQLGAIVSPQSSIISDRQILDDALKVEEERVAQGDLPSRPLHWGGYQIDPTMFEFWQGQTNRLHDRLKFVRNGEQWNIHRLAP